MLRDQPFLSIGCMLINYHYFINFIMLSGNNVVNLHLIKNVRKSHFVERLKRLKLKIISLKKQKYGNQINTSSDYAFKL